MFTPFNKDKFPLGLDLSELSLKLIQFSKQKDRVTVTGYSDATIPKEIFSGGDKIYDPKSLIKIIKHTISFPQFGKFATAGVVASIPETKSFVRVIQVPAMSEDEAAEAVPWEAEAHIPLPVGQVYLDWLILGKSETEGKMMVLLTASPKDYIDDVVALLKAADLTPLVLEVESQATVRSLVSGISETVLIVDIDANRTTLIVYDKGTLQFTFSLPIAGNVFTESIAKALDLDFEKAEKLKRRVGVGDSVEGLKVKKALSPVLDNIVGEIKNALKFYEEHSSESSQISRLLLTGGSSKLKHLPSFLLERLTFPEQTGHPIRSLSNLKVELANPWINVLKKGQTPPLSREESLGYATAIGLALREIE